MKKLLGLVFLFCAATVFSANPSLYIPWTAIRGTNGITTTTNPSVGVVIFDPQAFTNDSAFSNRVIQLVNANAPSGPWTNSLGTVSNLVTMTQFVATAQAPSGTTPYTFSTSASHTSGTLIQLLNAGARALSVGTNGGIRLGRNPASTGDKMFSSVSRAQSNEVATSTFELVQVSATNNVNIYATARRSDPSAEYYLDSTTNASVNYMWGQWKIYPNNISFVMGSEAVDFLNFNPTAGATANPYRFNTSVGHTSGNLAEIENAGVDHFQIKATNGIATPLVTAYAAVSQPWQLGSASNVASVEFPGFTATNVIEVVINGVAYLIPAKIK